MPVSSSDVADKDWIFNLIPTSVERGSSEPVVSPVTNSVSPSSETLNQVDNTPVTPDLTHTDPSPVLPQITESNSSLHPASPVYIADGPPSETQHFGPSLRKIISPAKFKDYVAHTTKCDEKPHLTPSCSS